ANVAAVRPATPAPTTTTSKSRIFRSAGSWRPRRAPGRLDRAAVPGGRVGVRQPDPERGYPVRRSTPTPPPTPCVALAHLAALAAAGVAVAQIPAGIEAAPDRMDKLVAGAKKEGTVTVYSSAAVDDLAVLIAAFEKKYGVKVRLWRGSSENILQRAVTEARGGRFDADVFETGSLAMESMRREQLFQAVRSPAFAELVPAAGPARREGIGTRINVFTAAYNTGLVKKDELPKRYDDLTDRRWKGRLGVEAEDSDWFGGVVGELGEERGLKLFRDIVAANGISVR